MRLSPLSEAFGGIADIIARGLDDRLVRDDPAPVVLALSGGGDSVALLLWARAWADRAKRRIVAVTVDHRLTSASAAWADTCRRRCEALGVAHVTRVWEGPHPSTGVAAAARDARHRRLAEAARGLGARVILMGHTADDVMEAALMREAGATTPSPRAWAPSPTWPEGRSVFILRPMLRVRRAALRHALAAMGEAWIDDPANEAPGSLRARVRVMVGDGGSAADETRGEARAGPAPFAVGPAGELCAATAALTAAPRERARAWLGAALLCAAGHDRPARSASLDRILDDLGAGAPMRATLAGARLAAEGGRILIARETGDARAGAPAVLALRPHATGVWDGRFEVRAGDRAVEIRALAGHMARLPRREQAGVRALCALARPGLPAVAGPDGGLTCPTIAPAPRLRARLLAPARLAAACGEIDHESAIVSWRSP